MENKSSNREAAYQIIINRVSSLKHIYHTKYTPNIYVGTTIQNIPVYILVLPIYKLTCLVLIHMQGLPIYTLV